MIITPLSAVVIYNQKQLHHVWPSYLSLWSRCLSSSLQCLGFTINQPASLSCSDRPEAIEGLPVCAMVQSARHGNSHQGNKPALSQMQPLAHAASAAACHRLLPIICYGCLSPAVAIAATASVAAAAACHLLLLLLLPGSKANSQATSGTTVLFPR